MEKTSGQRICLPTTIRNPKAIRMNNTEAHLA